MGILEIIIIAVSLSADSFAVTVSNTLCYSGDKKLKIAPFYFGIMQGLMPLIGYLVGSVFASKIQSVSHFVVFLLLTFIGLKMIRESQNMDCEISRPVLTHKMLLVQSIATSIDALAVGVSLSMFMSNISVAIAIISAVTVITCFVAVYIGKMISTSAPHKFGVIGGVVLILLGIKALF